MTLRVEFKIIPYGEEKDIFDIFRLDISNTGVVKDMGFGHQVCSYDAKLFKRSAHTMVESLGYPEWTEEFEIKEVLHDRRDGPLALAKNILEGLRC